MFLGGIMMKFENVGYDQFKADLKRLDEVMEEHGLSRSEHWDYERVSYDLKYELKEGVFYLRVQGYTVEGDIGANKAVIQLMNPILGKYYYPHGVEYGADESFPNSLVSSCEKVLADLKAEIEKFAA